MRRVVHISDLHFGHNDAALLDPLREAIAQADPHVLIVSGDLVEHATDEEFHAAQAFLGSLPCPQIVVPGNHDLPFWNLARRLLEGLRKFRRYITEDTSPEYVDDEIAIVGVDSAHRIPVKGGTITGFQLNGLVNRFSSFPDGLVRILVTHHPFDLPDPANPHLLVGRARASVAQLAPVVDVLLAGHIHVSSVGSTSARYNTPGHSMVYVQAGTAISSRYKGEENAFNLLHIGRSETKEKQIIVDRYSWVKDQSCFARLASTEFLLGKEGWAQVLPVPAR